MFQSLAFSGDDFNFDFDYSIFKDESSKNFVEFYYSFNPDNLIFIKTANGYEASGKISMTVINKSTQKTVVAKDFKVPISLIDTSGSFKHFKLTGQINVLLDTGTYAVKVRASDFTDSVKYADFNEDIVLKDFSKTQLSLSTIQLSTGIVKSDDISNIFYKNTLEVTPNPSALFGYNLNKLYYYLEIYNINTADLGSKYSVAVTIANQDGTEIKSANREYTVQADSKVEFGSVDITGLPSNRYLLLVKLFDEENEERLRAFKYFYIYNSDSNTATVNLTELENEYLLSEYPKMNEKDVEKEFNRAIYIMTDVQKGQYEQHKTLDEKRMFMFKYWKLISPILTKKEYFSRIEYANKNFRSDFRDGWKSDRGRVYSIFGKYDEIERFPYEGSTRAYEIWTYNKLQGGAIFVFIDMSAGYGDYQLVHSTAQNEIRDEEWQEKLKLR